jgi:hypothetical protein
LSVGQIYLLAYLLLREPLRIEHVKPRLLGHWGSTPGLNFIYAHLNRLIRLCDLDVIYVTGPGHGGPGVVANTYLEGTYSEVYPRIGHDEEGCGACFASSPSPVGSRATSCRRRRARSMRVASSATRSCTRSAVQAEQQPNRRRLARPVRAEISVHLARRDRQLESLQSARLAVALGQLVRVDRRGFGVGRHCR